MHRGHKLIWLIILECLHLLPTSKPSSLVRNTFYTAYIANFEECHMTGSELWGKPFRNKHDLWKCSCQKYHLNNFTILPAVASLRHRFHDSLFPCSATQNKNVCNTANNCRITPGSFNGRRDQFWVLPTNWVWCNPMGLDKEYLKKWLMFGDDLLGLLGKVPAL